MGEQPGSNGPKAIRQTEEPPDNGSSATAYASRHGRCETPTPSS